MIQTNHFNHFIIGKTKYYLFIKGKKKKKTLQHKHYVGLTNAFTNKQKYNNKQKYTKKNPEKPLNVLTHNKYANNVIIYYLENIYINTSSKHIY